MSWQATSWAKGVKTGSPSRKAVLMILAEHCDQWGYAWAGVVLIADEAELGERQVRRVLHELFDGGSIGICEPVKPGRGRFNLYFFAHGANAKAGAMPPEHPSLSDMIKPCRWAESGADLEAESAGSSEAEKGDKSTGIPDREIPDKLTGISDREIPDIRNTETGHLRQLNRSPMSGEPIGTRFEPERARDAAAVDNSGDAHASEPTGEDAGKAETEPPPACAVWREHEPALRRLPDWDLIKRAIPDADDGEMLTLAVEAPWVGFAILAWAVAGSMGLEAILGRRIECRVRRWVQAAAAERGQIVIGKPSMARHRRDGECLTLDDTAWVAWQTARREHPDCEWLDSGLPDDISEGRLKVAVGDLSVLTKLHEAGGEALAEAVGMRIKPMYVAQIDAGLSAQRRYGPLRAEGVGMGTQRGTE